MRNVYLTLVLFITILSNAQTFTLTSNELGGQATMKQVFNGFGYTGKNQSPELSWDNAPQDTKSFAITIYDEDAPTGSGWWHWLIFDIDKNIRELKSNSGDISTAISPKNSIQSKTDFGVSGYGGPCPPEGKNFHKYIVTIYALKVEKLGLDKNANPALVGFYLEQNTIEKSSMVFYYKR